MAFAFDDAIKTARSQIHSETVAHEKRMEFWVGYIAAMEEVRDRIEDQAR